MNSREDTLLAKFFCKEAIPRAVGVVSVKQMSTNTKTLIRLACFAGVVFVVLSLGMLKPKVRGPWVVVVKGSGATSFKLKNTHAQMWIVRSRQPLSNDVREIGK